MLEENRACNCTLEELQTSFFVLFYDYLATRTSGSAATEGNSSRAGCGGCSNPNRSALIHSYS